MFTIPSKSNTLWHKRPENSYELDTLMGMWNNLKSLVVIFLRSRKVLVGLVGEGARRGRVTGCLLILNPLLTFFFLSTLSAQGTHFTLSTPTKFWIHNMPEDHQSCLIPFFKNPETIIQMFATCMELKAALEELRELV